MAIWSRPVSWSKFKLALECPRQLEFVLNKSIVTDYRPDYYAVLGKVAQKCFEVYFNQRINLDSKGRSPAVMGRVVDKVLKSSYFKEMPVSFPSGKSQDTLVVAIREHVMQGFDLFLGMGILASKIDSEVKWNTAFNGFRMFGLLDFVRDTKQGIFIYDGKGNRKKDADPRQLLYYALICHAAGKKVAGGGLIYWQHDYEEVDLSPSAMKEFVEGDFARGRKLFESLKTGVSYLPASPAPTRCHYCNFSSICTDSLYRKEMPDMIQVGEVNFGD